MKARYLYLLMFAVPSVIAAFLTGFVVAGGIGGMLWLWVYGDNAWPAITEQLVMVPAVLIATAVFLMLNLASYVFGKEQEGAAPRFGRHAAIAAGICLFLVASALLHQLSVGNLGPKSDQQRCGEYCSDLGYRSSGAPSRHSEEQTCTCHGQYGEAEVVVPIAELPP